MLGKRRKREEARHVLAPQTLEAVAATEASVEILGKVIDRLPVEFPAGQQEELGQDGEDPGPLLGELGECPSTRVLLEDTFQGGQI